MKDTVVEIVIQKQPFQVQPGLIEGGNLLELAGIVPPSQLLLEIDDDIDIPVSPQDRMIIDGGEVFSIGDGEPPIVDNPCMRNPIRFEFNGKKIDKINAAVKPKLLGAEIKALDANSDSSDGLFADIQGFADEPIRDDWYIIVQRDDKFITTPCGNVGDSPKPAGIVELHYREVQKAYPSAQWHMHPAGNALVVPDIMLPVHWSIEKTDMLVIVPNGYPSAALDMYYVSPHVMLAEGGVPKAAETYEEHLGKKWQRFSWHYHSRRWNPGKDTLMSHLKFCISRMNMAE